MKKSFLLSLTVALLLLTNYSFAQWNYVGSPGFSPTEADNVSMVFDSTGTPYIACAQSDQYNPMPSGATVMKFDGIQWDTVGPSNFTPGGAETPSLAFDKNGTLYMAYGDDATSGFSVMKFDGTNWDAVGSTGNQYNLGAINPAIAIAPDGTPYVVASDIGDNLSLYVMKFDGSNWVTVGSGDFTPGGYYIAASSVKIDKNGTPYVAFFGFNSSNYNCGVMKFDGSNWVSVGSTIIAPDNAYGVSLALDTSGTPYVGYPDGGANGQATVRKFDGTNWDVVGSAGFTNDMNVEYPSLAFDNHNNLYFAYDNGLGMGGDPSVLKFDGANWNSEGSPDFISDNVQNVSLAISNNGTPYLAFTDGNNSNKASVMSFGCAAPSFTSQPTADTVCAGINASFIVATSDTTVTYQWQENQGSGFANISNNSIYSGATNDTLTITSAVNMNGFNYRCILLKSCGATDTSNIAALTVDTIPNVVANVSQNYLCGGGRVFFGATGANSYQWDNGVMTGGGNYYVPSTTTYHVIGTDGNNCSAADSVTVTVNNPPQVSAFASADSICGGSNVILYGFGAVSYSWDNGVTDSVAFAPSGTNTYHLVGTDINGCSNSDSVTVTVNNPPQVSAFASADSICSGSNVILYGFGTVSYSWDNGVTDSVAFAPSGTNTYHLVGTDINGCTNNDSVTVTVNNPPQVSAFASADSICGGSNVILYGFGAVSYSWDNGVTDSIAFAPSGTNTYHLVGTDINGCSNSDSVTVTVNNPPKVGINIPDTSICWYSSITLSGTGATSYVWDRGITDGVAFNPLGTLTYHVIGTDGNGCSATDSVTVTVNLLPTNLMAHATDTIVCKGGNVTLTGSGAQTYIWSNNVTDGVSFVPDSTNTYKVIGIDSNGCRWSVVITVAVDTPHVIANASLTTICEGENVVLYGSGSASYTWDNSVTDSIAFAPSSTNTYHLVGTDINGCSNSDSVTVSVNPAPNVQARALLYTVCSGAPTFVYGQGATSYQWDNGVTNNTTFYPTQTATYHVIGTNINGCTATDSVKVTVNPAPNVQARALLYTVCSGAPTFVYGQGATSYQWDNGVTNNTTFYPTQTATYHVIGTNSNGCTAADSVKVTVNPLPNIGLSAVPNNRTVCVGGSMTLTATGGVTYLWSDGVMNGVPFSTTNPMNVDPRSYSVTVTDVNGCSATSGVATHINPLPMVKANASLATICDGDDVILYGSGAVSYTWDNSVTDSVAFAPSATNTYHVTGTDANSCSASNSITITVNNLGAPVATAGTDIATTQFTANWSAAAGATSYTLLVATDSLFTTFVPGYNGLNVGNATSHVVTGLSPVTTYYYLVVASNGGSCPVASSNAVSVATITGNCIMTGGTVSPALSVVCSTITQELTVSGASGGTLQWQVSNDNITWSDIIGATNENYITPFASQKEYYRCVTLSLSCYNVSSTTAEVDISITPVVTLTNPTSTSVTVSWTPFAPGQYNISWSGGAGSGSALAVANNGYIITGLTPNQKLQVTVTQATPSCNGVVNGTASATTSCGAPTNLQLTALTSSVHGFKASWTGVNGVTSYRIYYRDLFTASNWSFIDTAGTNKTIILPAGGQTYAVYVASKNCPTTGVIGQGSDLAYVTTNPLSGCTPIPVIVATSSCPNHIDVTITGGSGPYALTLRKLSPSMTVGSTYTVNGSSVDIAIGTEYAGSVWEVFARTNCGAGSLSEISNLALVTVQPSCPSVGNVVVSQVNCTGFSASWNSNNCNGSGANSYELLIKKSTALNYSTYPEGLNEHTEVNWLSAGSTYDVEILVATCNGALSPSSTPDVVTLPACRVAENAGEPAAITETRSESVLLYPNPAQYQFSIDIGRRDMTEATVKIELISELGQVIQTNIATISGGHLMQIVNVGTNVSSGVYLVRTTVGANVYVNNVVISH